MANLTYRRDQIRRNRFQLFRLPVVPLRHFWLWGSGVRAVTSLI